MTRAVAVVVGLVLAAFAHPVAERIQQALFATLGERAVGRPSDVALVLVDRESESHPAFAAHPRVHWSSPMAAVVDALLDAGAAVVAVDLVFTRDDADSDDWLLTLRRGGRDGRIVLGMAGGRYPALPTAAQRLAVGGSTALASVTLVPDPDGVIRRMPHEIDGVPTFSAAAVTRAGADVRGARRLIGSRLPEFVTWSAGAVIEHRGTATLVDAFAGRVVLVGPWLPGEDLHSSAFGTRPGIWLHALATDAWLHRATERSLWWPVSLAFAVALAVAGAGCAARQRVDVIVSTLAAILVSTWSAWWMAVWIPGATFLVAFGGTVMTFAALRLGVVVWRACAALPARFRADPDTACTGIVTVCFIDIAAFTSTGERTEPMRLAADLDRCLTELTHIIEAHDGFVDKYLGDGLMALFGLTGEDPGCRDAFAAARRCLDARLTLADTPVQLRIGIASGPARLGALGGARRRQFTAIGDTVNVAARLEQLTRSLDSPLLVDDAVAAATPEGAWQTVGEHRLRGRGRPVRIWATGIIGESCASRSQSSSCSPSPPSRSVPTRVPAR